jgi:hypothetical protein
MRGLPGLDYYRPLFDHSGIPKPGTNLRLRQAQRSAGKNEVYPDFIFSHELDPKPGEKRRLSGTPMPISDLRF